MVSKEANLQKWPMHKRPCALVCGDFYKGENLGEGTNFQSIGTGEDHKAGFTIHKPMMMHRGQRTIHTNQWGFV